MVKFKIDNGYVDGAVKDNATAAMARMMTANLAGVPTAQVRVVRVVRVEEHPENNPRLSLPAFLTPR